MRNIAVIAVVFWALFLDGYSNTIKPLLSGGTLQSIPQTVLKGAERVSTGGVADAPARPALNVAPAGAPARIVVPQGMPELPTATPAALAIVSPVSNEEATKNAEVYALIVAPPTPIQYGTDECNSSNAKFKGVKTIEKNGVPIGQVEAISCTSQAEVDEGLRIREYAMLANNP